MLKAFSVFLQCAPVVLSHLSFPNALSKTVMVVLGWCWEWRGSSGGGGVNPRTIFLCFLKLTAKEPKLVSQECFKESPSLVCS